MRFNFLKITLTILALTSIAFGNDDTKARMMWERLVGSYGDADQAKVSMMSTKLASGDVRGAAAIATAEKRFIDYTVGRLVAPWTNRPQNPNIPAYNSTMALAQGIVRDNLDFRQFLTGNFLYVSNTTLRGKARTGTGLGTLGTTAVAPPAASRANEFNWQFIEDNGFSPSDSLVKQTGNQWSDGGSFSDFSGFYTLGTSKFLYDAGTNRRPVEFTFKNFMCTGADLHPVMDTQVSDRYVGRDVDRSDYVKYSNQCIGCHGAVLDSQRKAFAYLDAPGGTTLNFLTTVAPKYANNNGIFPAGYIVSDNNWENLATHGPNQDLGWRGSMSGQGINSYAQMIANSGRFSVCMVTQVFRQVCLREPTADETSQLLAKIAANDFEANQSYSLRTVYEAVASLDVCTGK